MTATSAPTARPATAAIAWATRDGLFVEIPCKDGPPYIARYHKTVEGLTAALNILLDNPETESRTIQRDHPKIKHGPKTEFGEAERVSVREIMKKAGML